MTRALTKPVWLRVSPAIRSFILGEVERQYHPIGTAAYAERVEWMTDAWQWAMENDHGDPPTVEDILHVAAMIEPVLNANGFRWGPVWIGGKQAPIAEAVPQMVRELWEEIGGVIPEEGRRSPGSGQPMTADNFYLEFEHIHPFYDGNGRTGKLLHNWLLGRLDRPVLVRDYFGGGNP